MKNILIVESPNKQKTIEKYLGKKDFKILASVGHVRDLSTGGKYGMGVKDMEKMDFLWKIDKDKQKIVQMLKKEVGKADNILLATDPDREGEAIAWHLQDILLKHARKKSLHQIHKNRVTFNEITKKVVTEAVNNPREINLNLVRSQFARRLLDRIIGFRASRLTRKSLHAESAGRVQSIALKIIVDREKEIKAFVSSKFWLILITLENRAGLVFRKINEKFLKNCDFCDKHGNFSDKKIVDEIDNDLTDDFYVYSVEKSKINKRAPAPFTTSTMQQSASQKINFSPKKTMMIAQKLFEGIERDGERHGVITYHRTDSTRISETFISEIKKFIINPTDSHYELGLDYWNNGFYNHGKSKKELVQDAHEAIRVTDINMTPEKIAKFLDNNEQKLYKLIWLRTLAVFSTPAVLEKSVVRVLNYGKQNPIINNETIAPYKLYFTKSKWIFKGYRKYYTHFKADEDEIDTLKNIEFANYKIGDKIKVKSKEIVAKETQPPSRYSDASLIRQLDNLGIGRPSTYSTMVSTNYDRKYIAKVNGQRGIKPTEKGEETMALLEKYLPETFNYQFTATTEKHLDLIEHGKEKFEVVVHDFYEKFEPTVEKALASVEKKPDEKTGELCPNCGKDLVFKHSRFGKFIGCSNYPECRYIKKTPRPPLEKTGQSCPECGKDLVYRYTHQKQRKFVGCSGFPKCHHIEKIQKEKTEKAKNEIQSNHK